MVNCNMIQNGGDEVVDGPVVSEGGRSPSTLPPRPECAGDQGRRSPGPAGAQSALERGAQAGGGAAADARRSGRAALARARPAAVQARAMAAESRSRAGGGPERARGVSDGTKPFFRACTRPDSMSGSG